MMILITRLFLLYVIAFSAFALSNEESNDAPLTKNKVTLSVSVEREGYFPFNYEDDGKRKGFAIDILDYINANSKYNFKFVEQPWARALSHLSEGKIDLLITLFKSSEREKIYHILEPSYGFEVNQLFTLKNNNIAFDGQLQQLIPYSIGVKNAYSYGVYFDQASYLNKYPVLTESILIKMLVGDRVDAILGNPFMLNRIAKQENVSDKIKAITPYVSLTPVHLALTKKRKDSIEVKQTFEKLIKQLKSSNYYQELLDKYQLKF
jgi:polar amino acid transport system substrate-binding protein